MTTAQEIATDEAHVNTWMKKVKLGLMTPEQLLYKLRGMNEKYRIRRQIREN